MKILQKTPNFALKSVVFAKKTFYASFVQFAQTNRQKTIFAQTKYPFFTKVNYYFLVLTFLSFAFFSKTNGTTA